MVHITPCFRELWPFVYENSPFETMSTLLVEYFYQNLMKLGHIFVKYRDVFFKFDNGPYRTMLSAVMALCL